MTRRKKECKPHIESLIEELKNNGLSYSLMRELGQYMINIKKSDNNKLNGFLREYNGVNVLDQCYKSMYSPEVGLTLPIDDILIL